jgi:acetoacetate decarboxylase
MSWCAGRVDIASVRRPLTIPIGAQAYPRGAYRFTDREYLNIVYRTDADDYLTDEDGAR